MKIANILSIDGGGIRGIIALEQLLVMEKLIDVPLYKYFDYIVGTSTGSIVAVLLSIGYSASDLLDLYYIHGSNIFDKKFFRFGITRPKYSDKYFNEILYKYVGDKTLSDCKTNIIIPAYNGSKSRIKLFKSSKSSIDNYSLFDVIRSSSSAPTFFSPWEINGDLFIDGGLVANNPSVISLIEAIKSGYEYFNIISFSTGDKPKSIEDKVGYGILGMASPTVDILFSEQAKTTDYVLDKLFELNPNLMNRSMGLYTRCLSIIEKSSGEIDDASPNNIKNMMCDGKLSASNNLDKIKIFCEKSKKC